MLREKGVTQELHKLEHRARRFRRDAQKHLLGEYPENIGEEYQHLFYPTEESEEFE